MKPTFLALILIALIPCAQAQTSGNLPKDCSIAGSVVDGVTGQPLPGAQVLLRGMPGSGGQPGSTTTDASGEFKIDNLTSGRYVVRALHQGYIAQGRGGAMGVARTVEVSPGQHVDGVVISLTPGGAISGHITDDAGNAVAGAQLTLMRYSYTSGQRELNEVASATSDQTGEYRIGGLLPAKYYLRAASPAAKRAKTETDKAYVPVYYPHATDQAGAATIGLGPGEDLGGIDISFAPMRAVRVKGQVIDSRTSLPSKGATVTLMGDQGNTVFPPGEISVDATGSFDLRGIPQGSYVLVAQASAGKGSEDILWGRTQLEVGEADVTGVKVMISVGADVTGHIRSEGKTNLEMGKLTARLACRDGSAVVNSMPDFDDATVNPDGTFTFRKVPEGNYELEISPLPSGYYLKLSNGGDAPDTVAVSHGHAMALPEMAFISASGSVTGTVSRDDRPAAGAVVVLVPDGKRRSQARFFKRSTSDRLGRFTLRGIAPGDYTIFAWEEVDRDAFLDPDFLRQYEDSGRSVHVEGDSQENVQIDVIPSASE